MKKIVSAIAAALVASALPAVAQVHGHDHGVASAAPAGDYTQGEVKKIDKDASKITLKHGPIANLDMPGMTMVFRAKDPAALDNVKVGDNVLFKVERIDGALTVTELRKAS